MTIVDVTKDNECCCSCIHNKRTFDKDCHCTCTCELDGHHIGYVANFESVCEEWEGARNYYTNNWTAKQTDDEIKVGDEVEVTENGIKFFVTKIYEKDGTVGGINKDGEVRYWSRSLVKPTGRHFDIASILEDMRK